MSSGTNTKGRRLGRGLSALLNDSPPVAIDVPRTAPTNGSGAHDTPRETHAPARHETPAPSAHGNRFITVALTALRANPWQPRRTFDEATISMLAESIRVAGMMQPIVVRKAPNGAGYELIAGERRWRAAQKLELESIPAIVAELSDQEAAEWALVENLQREDLNPMDRARGLQRLCEQFSLTQREVAARTGLDRSTVANMMRLAELEPPIIAHVENGKLSAGHAKALLAMMPGQPRIDLAEQAVRGGWSVRRLESAMVTALGALAKGKPAAPQSAAAQAAHEAQANLRSLERDISETLGTKVRLHTDRSGKKGRVVIHFYDLDQFDGLLQKFGVKVM